VLTPEQVSHFRGFGFIVVDGLVDIQLLDDLSHESNSALDQAFGGDTDTQLRTYLAGRGGPRPGSVLGQYLPVMSPATPISLSLTGSGPLVGAAQQLLGTSAPIAKPAKAVRYVSPSGWHIDCGSGVPAVKIIYYLESAEEITFELIPASHLETASGSVIQLLGEKGDRQPPAGPAPMPPTTTVRLKRHQALIFNVALWHRNPSTSARTQWSVTYIAEPTDAAGLHDAVSFIGSFFGKHPSYEKKMFPFFPADWIDGSSDSPLAQNLNRSGAMKQFVERFGAFL
jgi:hypothetical protein